MVVKKMFTSIIFAIALVVSAPRFNEVVAQQVSSKAATVNSSNVGGAIDHAVQTPQTPDMPLLSQTQSERLDLVLIGTVSGGSEGLALFVDRKSKDVVSLRVGESRSGWTLRSIEPEKVTVERGDESESIRLHQLAAGGGGVQRTLNSSNPAPNTALPSFASNPSFLKNLVQADGATPSPLVPPSVVQAPPATNVPMSSLSPSGVRLAQANGAASITIRSFKRLQRRRSGTVHSSAASRDGADTAIHPSAGSHDGRDTAIHSSAGSYELDGAGRSEITSAINWRQSCAFGHKPLKGSDLVRNGVSLARGPKCIRRALLAYNAKSAPDTKIKKNLEPVATVAAMWRRRNPRC